MIAIPCALATLHTVFLSLIFANLKAEKCHLTVYFVLCYEFSLLNLMYICFSLPLNDQFWPLPVFPLGCFYLSDSYYAPFMLLMVVENVPCKEQGTGLTITLRDRGWVFLCTKNPGDVQLLAFALWLSLVSSGVSWIFVFSFFGVVCFFLLDQKILVPVTSVLFIKSYSFPWICKEVYNGWSEDKKSQKTLIRSFGLMHQQCLPFWY